MTSMSNKGFTLIELIIFIIVGGILLPLAMIAFTSAMKSASVPDYTIKARFYAEKKMEELTSYSYAAMPGSGGPEIPETGYIINWTINTINPTDFSQTSPDPNYKKIEITVTPPTGSTNNYVVSTIVTKRPKAP